LHDGSEVQIDGPDGFNDGSEVRTDGSEVWVDESKSLIDREGVEWSEVCFPDAVCITEDKE
jgi:hypothetical protein